MHHSHTVFVISSDDGVFGIATLRASTRALESVSSGDATYRSLERAIARMGSERDALAAQISDALNNLEFDRQVIVSSSVHAWTNQANALMVQASELGG